MSRSFLLPSACVLAFLLWAGCSSEHVSENASQGIAVKDSFEVNEAYFTNAIKTSGILDSAAASALKIKGLVELRSSPFKYSILDTLLLKEGVTSIIVAKYHDNESFAFLVNYASSAAPSYTTVYYDNAEGCWQTRSALYPGGNIVKYNYDCYSDEGSDDEKKVERFELAKTGALRELTDTLPAASKEKIALQDISNDSVNVGFSELNAVIQMLSDSKDASVVENPGYSWGDCEGTYKKIADSKGNVLYLFKTDCGEWGFDNSQFYLRNDSLMLVRIYDYSFLHWLHDRPMYQVEEEVYKFANGKVTAKKRGRVLTTGHNHSLYHLPFRDSIADYEDALFELTDELEEMLQLQETGEEEEEEE